MFVNQAGGLRGQRRDILGLDEHKKKASDQLKLVKMSSNTWICCDKMELLAMYN